MRYKRYKLVTGIILLNVLFISCLKDKGNYTYKQVGDPVVVTGIDSLYLVDVLNQSFKITPVITLPDGSPVDTSKYSYSWQINQEIGGQDYPSLTPLSTQRDLDIPQDKMISTITNAQVRGYLFGSYVVFFRVTEKATGLFKDTYFKVIFGSVSSNGWMLLCDDGTGNSRLSMISSVYNDSLVTDILATMKSTFPTSGQPRFITIDYQVRFTPNSGPSPYIGTSRNLAVLGSDTLEYKLPRYNLRNYISGLSAAANFSSVSFASNGYLHYLQNDGDVYYLYEYYDNEFVACNYLNNTRFNASSYVAISGNSGAIVFDEDTKTFLRSPIQSYCLELPAGTLFNFSTNQNLRYMESTSTFNGGEVFAVLDSSSKINLARFTYQGVQNYYKEIIAPDISKAELFAVDDNFGFVFYSVGGKLYEYNMINRAATLIHDYGDNKITVLKSFTDISDLYKNEFGNVVVGTYNDADKRSGTFDLYTNPKIDGSMSLVKSIRGVGKIVDAAYK